MAAPEGEGAALVDCIRRRELDRVGSTPGARDILAQGFDQGFSTITMQLARNVFPERITRETIP